MALYNKLSPEQLVQRLNSENFERKTVSFYRYIVIGDPQEFRDSLYIALDRMQCNGRIYVAHEGSKAQMNVPADNVDAFIDYLNSIPILKDVPLKWALEENVPSFLKLIVRVRPKIVADGLNDTVFDVTNVGNRLSPMEFHALASEEDVLVTLPQPSEVEPWRLSPSKRPTRQLQGGKRIMR